VSVGYVITDDNHIIMFSSHKLSNFWLLWAFLLTLLGTTIDTLTSINPYRTTLEDMKLLRHFLVASTLAGGSLSDAWSPSGPAKSLELLVARRFRSQKTHILHSTTIDTSGTAGEPIKKASDAESKEVIGLPFVPSKLIGSTEVRSAVSVFGGTVMAFVLNNLLSLGPVQGSSVTGLLATLLLPEKLALAALCGSFAGMANTIVIPGVGAGLLLGAVCAGMMALFDKKKWLVGVGGRLGFIAQCACTSQFLVSTLFSVPSAPAALIGSYPGMGKLLSQLPAVSFFTAVGALFMSCWKEALGEKANMNSGSNVLDSVYKRLSNSVGAVGATGALAALLFPASIAGPIFCGSFIAMSSPARLETDGALVGASLLGGVCQQLLAGVLLGGWGGKLGTASLMGVLAYNLLANRIKDFETVETGARPVPQPETQ
jgi:hypothetical protein